MLARMTLTKPKSAVKIGTRTRGDSRATTFPANIGLLLPVQSTPRLPHCCLAVTSHAMRAAAKPRTGERDACPQTSSQSSYPVSQVTSSTSVELTAHLFWPDQVSASVAGRTADEMMTPIMTGVVPCQQHASKFHI